MDATDWAWVALASCFLSGLLKILGNWLAALGR